MSWDRIIKMIVRIYPAPWRSRYQDELSALIQDQLADPDSSQWRIAIGCLWGALSERVNPSVRAVPEMAPAVIGQSRFGPLKSSIGRTSLVLGSTAVVLALSLLVAAGFFASQPGKSFGVGVPRFVGKGWPSTGPIANDAGVILHVHWITSSRPVASVISQSPPAGSRIALGGVVTLTISNGSTPSPLPGAKVVVPDVIGLLLSQAVSTLHRAGISDSFGTATCNVGTNHVVAQYPVFGSSVPQGSRISLSCS
jgi:hypothetical protein